MSETIYCSKEVQTRDGWHFHQCSRKGVVQFEGKWFCKQHDTKAVKKKRKKSDLKDKLNWAKKSLVWIYAAVGKKACVEFKEHGRFGYAELSEEIENVEKALEEIEELKAELKEVDDV